MISSPQQFLCFLALLLPAQAQAQQADSAQQQTRDPLLVGARWHYGFIIPHSRDIANVAASHPRGVELSVQW